MLIDITKSCHNGCIHCCNDSTPSDCHMSLETFKDALEFSKKYDIYNMVSDELAGGEPMEHPLFFEFIDTYFEFFKDTRNLTIASNGHGILENPKKVHEYLDKYENLFFQITYDSRYYPKKLDTTKRALRHKRICIITEVSHIYPKGRAVTNNLKISDCVMSPPCINLKLLLMQLNEKSLVNVIKYLRLNNKFCIPSIHYDGSIAFGEYVTCPKYVSIYDDEKTIIDKMNNFDCHECKEALAIFEKRFMDGSLKLRNL